MYTLQFVFELPGGKKLQDYQTPETYKELSFTLQSVGEGIYILRVDGFQDKAAGENFLEEMAVAFDWVLLTKDFPYRANLELKEVSYITDPVRAAKNLKFGRRVDGMVANAHPAVYRTNEKIVNRIGHRANITLGMGAEIFFMSLFEGLSFSGGTSVLQEDKLKLGIDLYNAHYYEQSISSKFLTLMMVLEALMSSEKRPVIALCLLKEWQKAVEDRLAKTSDDDDCAALDSLKKTLEIAEQKDSLRSQVRNLVLSTLAGNGDSDAKERAWQAVKLYDLRSELLHDGYLPPRKLDPALSQMKSIAQRILTIKYRNIADIPHVENV